MRDKKKKLELKICKKKKDLEKEKFLHLKWLVYFVQLKKKKKKEQADICNDFEENSF